MAQTSVAQFASELKVPPSVLLEQLRAAGVDKKTPADQLSEQDKSRLLEPPLASGEESFEPSASKFGVWMMPSGVGLLASDDADGFDGQHRLRTWTLRDAAGAVIPGCFLLGGEEAANGDYQDYVFLLTNVRPAP